MPAAQSQAKPLAYIAGPLFNAAERAQAEGVDAICRRAGFHTFLPHRDGGLLGTPGRTPARVFRADLAGLQRADVLVAILNGPAVDPGTAWEIGYGFARGLPLVGYLDDLRARPGAEPVDLMVSRSCNLVRSTAELRHVLRALRAVSGGLRPR
jgi:nucleoside 2-deoxyribosyltransferase